MKATSRRRLECNPTHREVQDWKVTREGQGKRQEDVQLMPGRSSQGQAAGHLQERSQAQAGAGLSVRGVDRRLRRRG